MTKKSVCLKVSRIQGQTAIATLNKMDLTDRTLRIQKDAESLCIPLVRQPNKREQQQLETEITIAKLETRAFEEKGHQAKSLTDVLANKLLPDLLASLPRALDIIGDIAVVEIPAELKSHEAEVGEAVMSVHRNVRVVLAKAGAVSGVYRLRDLEFVAGEQRTSTVHKEHGCSFYVDVAKAYFSPRLGTEHVRVAALVGDGETVVDLFAGIGPFAVLIAKAQPTARVYAIDVNADAVELLKKNARLNRVESKVIPIVGDARRIVAEQLSGLADRVIMNLPESAGEFVDVACSAVKPNGGVVHFYGFLKTPNTLDDLKRRFSEAIEKNAREVVSFQRAKMVRETAPYEYQAVLDAEIR